MIIERNIQGYIVISDIIENQRVERKYLYFSEKEAIAKFMAEFPTAEKPEVYNHDFNLMFAIRTTAPTLFETPAAEIRAAIQKRLDRLTDEEINEAIEDCYNTYCED